jgi:hypothetical protein
MGVLEVSLAILCSFSRKTDVAIKWHFVIELETGPLVEIIEGRQGDHLFGTTGRYRYNGFQQVRTGYFIVHGMK